MAAPVVPGFSDLTEVGRGGFGVVYRAPQPGFGREVAIKLLNTGTRDERARRRFDRETATTGKLSGHPHIVTLYQAGFTAEDRPYLVMPFYPAGSLRDRVEAGGPLAADRVATIGVQLSGALATAHAAGIIHRDVKPDNVLVDEFGAPVLTDFGIASVTTDGGLSTSTATGQLTMTLAYSPPEVLDGARPEQRTDVFALGATLFALLSGTPPFVRPGDDSVAPVLARMMREDAPDLATMGVPGPLAEVIAKALARELEDRTPTAAALGQQLQDAQRQMGQARTEMVLPQELDAGAAQERTLALPDLELPGPYVTPGSDSGPAQFPATEPLGATPATTPTARSDQGRDLGHGHGPGGHGADHGGWDQQAAAVPRLATTPLPHQPSGPQPPGPQPPSSTLRQSARAGLVGTVVGLIVLAGVGVGLYLGARDQPGDVQPGASPAVTQGQPLASPVDPTDPTTGPPMTSAAPSDPNPTVTEPATPAGAPTTDPPVTPDPTEPVAPDVEVVTDDIRGPAVARTLQQWHDGINTADYSLAFATYDAGLQDRVTFAQFRDGNLTSRIIAPAVEGIRDSGAELIATIAFRSTQDPSLGPDGQACSDWVLDWTMRPSEADLEWLVTDVDAIGGTPLAC